MLNRLKQLFNKIVFHIQCSLRSSCCTTQKENDPNTIDAVEKNQIYIQE